MVPKCDIFDLGNFTFIHPILGWLGDWSQKIFIFILGADRRILFVKLMHSMCIRSFLTYAQHTLKQLKLILSMRLWSKNNENPWHEKFHAWAPLKVKCFKLLYILVCSVLYVPKFHIWWNLYTSLESELCTKGSLRLLRGSLFEKCT